MPKIITEDMIEQAAIKALQERHDYNILNCMTEEPDTLPDGIGHKDKKQVVLPDVMLESLCRINPDIPEQTVRTVVDELCHTPVSGDLMLTNYQNYQKIRNGITVEYNENGKKTSNILCLLSYNDVLSNTFTVASQMWIKGETHWRRPDLIIFINGFPMVFIELKNSNIPVKNAYDINLKNYLKDIPYLFNYNQICVLSNGMGTRLGSFAAGYEFFFEWLKVENEKENPDRKAIRENCTSLEYFIAGLCKPKNLLDYIENFILYDRRRIKIIAKNHQFFGVNNAYNAFLRREKLKGKCWLIHLQQVEKKSYSSIHSIRGVLRPAFQLAVDDDLIRKNPFQFQLMEVVVNDSVTREAISRAEERKFLRFVKEDPHFCRYYEGIYILFKTGLRISEFCGLTISDIDFKEHTINIDHQLQKKSKIGYYIQETKTTSGTRKIPMTADVEECFRKIIEKRNPPKAEPMVDGKSGFLYFDKNESICYSLHWEHYFQHIIQKYNNTYKVQMPVITPHVCRHTYCSNMAKSGMNPKALQYLMGHSEISVTLNTYTHVNLEDAREEVARIQVV